MKVSDFLGRRVISTAGREGYVFSVELCDEQQIYLACADGNEREFYVGVKSAANRGGRIIFEESATPTHSTPLRLGRACFDQSGNYLGRLQDFTVCGGRLKTARVANKNYPVEGLILGDIALLKDVRRIRRDVTKNGKVLFKKGTPVTEELLNEAALCGEYVQTTLKSL